MKRVDSFQFLRFLAALSVIFYHYGQGIWLSKTFHLFVFNGPRMFSLFYVLSGFVLTVSHIKRNIANLRDYYVSRIARIVPVYMVALFLSALLSGSVSITALFLNLTFLQAWFPPYPLSINSPAWSLSVQAFFFFIFPFILSAIQKNNLSWQKFGLIALVFYVFTQAIISNLMSADFYTGFPSPSHDLIYYFPLPHLCSFILGMAGGYLYASRPEWYNKPGYLPLFALIGAIAINFLILQYPDNLQSIAGFPLVYGASFNPLPYLLLILGLAYSQSFITRAMALPFLEKLGEISYSLYILQQPIETLYREHILTHIAGLIKIIPDGSFYIYVLLLILISFGSLYCIEKPGKKLILEINKSFQKMHWIVNTL